MFPVGKLAHYTFMLRERWEHIACIDILLYYKRGGGATLKMVSVMMKILFRSDFEKDAWIPVREPQWKGLRAERHLLSFSSIIE